MSDAEQDVPTEGESEGPHSSEAEIIEAEAALETPAAPTGEATWAEEQSAGEESG